MANSTSIDIADTRLELLSERAAYWADEEALLVADVHLGKDATFQSEAVPLPLGSTQADLERLDGLLRRTRAERLVVLGDLYHAAQGMTAETLDLLRSWRRDHPRLQIELVRGNHDRRAGPSPAELGIEERTGPVVEPPFVFQHEPGPSSRGVVIAGHVHPVALLRGRGGVRERLPCFYKTPDSLTLPAFGEFTGGHAVTPGPNEYLYLIAEDEVLAHPLSQER